MWHVFHALIRCGASFEVEIVSEQFVGKRLLERHRMVNGALVEEMKDIHALSIKALTPEQQLKKQQDSEKSQAAVWEYAYDHLWHRKHRTFKHLTEFQFYVGNLFGV